MFIDSIQLMVQAGSGGNGCESYLRRTDMKKVPTGGDGGRGGSIIIRSDTNSPPLAALRTKRRLVAASGGHGGNSRKRGKSGEDSVLLVPIGTRIFDREKNFLIRELLEWGEEVVVLKGGEGGTGNHRGRDATHGEKGAQIVIELSIRLVADVFLVGLPGSGKSKILNAWTRAHAKEGNYPFTTKSPEIGVYAYSEYDTMTICELPSLYGGSHEGRGAGNAFLKHLERAKYILYVLDPVTRFAESLSQGWEILQNEVRLHQKDFLNIPCAVVVNKVDLEEVKEKIASEKFKPNVPLFSVSALTGEGLEVLANHLKEKIFHDVA